MLIQPALVWKKTLKILYTLIQTVLIQANQGYIYIVPIYLQACTVSIYCLYLLLYYIHNSPRPFTYFPFGLGYRSCIGRQLAMVNLTMKTAIILYATADVQTIIILIQMQAKVILCKVLPSFIFRLPDGYKPEIAIRVNFQPKDKVPVTVTLR